MEKDIFKKIPLLGFYHQKCNKFNDSSLFKVHHNYIKLTKVKIWYGETPSNLDNEQIHGKCVLGIECEYQNILTGEKAVDRHCGNLSKSEFTTHELDLKEADYIYKFEICFNDVIRYLEFQTKNEKKLIAGIYDKDSAKTINLSSENNMNMIQYFFGYFNEFGLRALGCTYLNRNRYFFLMLVDYFRYRWILKNNEEEKNRWTEQEIAKLGYFEKTSIKLCLLPKSLFFCVIKFCS